MQREQMEYDVAIVGAGPAGMAAAIRLGQLSRESGMSLRVCVLEKGAQIGAHILSGAAIDLRALNLLLPQWKELGAPLNTLASEDRFYWLTSRRAIRFPVPPQMRNEGNYIISLGQFCQWLGEQAQAIGVDVFPGFPAAEFIEEDGAVKGVITGDMGRARDGSPKQSFQPGVEIRAKFTLLAEGCRGSLSEQIIKRFNLREGRDPQTYGIGIKELWEIEAGKHKPGRILHTVGWPLDKRTYGGSFLYHWGERKLAIGLVVGLDYENPYLDPYEEFQRFKTHSLIRPLLEGARRLAYGSRALNEGGYQSIPRLAFPGGALIGDAAGFLNVPKIKGTHTAMMSGMLAAEACIKAVREQTSLLSGYEDSLRQSWVGEELFQARNIRPAFRKGLLAGMAYAAADTYLLRGRAPWTFRHTRPDHASLRPAGECRPITYPAHDGKITFGRMESVYLSGANHAEDQPVHLVLRDPGVPIQVNLPLYDAPEQRYCPAGVYEIVRDPQPRLQINAQNCVHCKTCDIKDPTQNIQWVTPEGGGGPNYTEM